MPLAAPGQERAGTWTRSSPLGRRLLRSGLGEEARGSDVLAWARVRLSALWRSSGPALVAGLIVLPWVTGVALSYFYFGDWPTKNPFDQVFAAGLAGVGLWVVISLVFLRGSPQNLVRSLGKTSRKLGVALLAPEPGG